VCALNKESIVLKHKFKQDAYMEELFLLTSLQGRSEGVVKFFNPMRKYGYIRRNQDAADVKFHAADVRPEWTLQFRYYLFVLHLKI